MQAIFEVFYAADLSDFSAMRRTEIHYLTRFPLTHSTIMKIFIEFEIDSSFCNEDGSVARWEIGQFIAKEVRYRADCLLDDPDNSCYGSEIDLRGENGKTVGIVRKIDDEADR